MDRIVMATLAVTAATGEQIRSAGLLNSGADLPWHKTAVFHVSTVAGRVFYVEVYPMTDFPCRGFIQELSDSGRPYNKRSEFHVNKDMVVTFE